MITYETRREAYENVDAQSIRMKITRLLKESGGMTASEIMERLNISNPNNCRPRLSELKEDGVIVAIGKRKSPGRRMPEAIWELAV